MARIYKELRQRAYTDPESLHEAPRTTPVRRLDDVRAARTPVLKYDFDGTPGE